VWKLVQTPTDKTFVGKPLPLFSSFRLLQHNNNGPL
jgi:hypothetical protein